MNHEAVVLEPALALSAIAIPLNTLALPYFLVGSFASGLHGEFRSTNDIDIVCQLTEKTWLPLYETIKNEFVVDEVAIPGLIRDGQSFNIIHDKTFLKVDIFTRIGDFEHDQFNRTLTLQIPGTTVSVRVSTVEYNILAKLRWYEKSNRQLERQLRDVRGMVEVNRGELDMDYLDTWGNRLKVSALLHEMLKVP